MCHGIIWDDSIRFRMSLLPEHSESWPNGLSQGGMIAGKTEFSAQFLSGNLKENSQKSY